MLQRLIRHFRVPESQVFLFYFSGEAVSVKYSDFTRRQSYEQRQADAEAHGDTER